MIICKLSNTSIGSSGLCCCTYRGHKIKSFRNVTALEFKSCLIRFYPHLLDKIGNYFALLPGILLFY